MKKILHSILLAFILLPGIVQAQEEVGPVGAMWSNPAVYKYDEQVTWYFDLSSTTFVMGEDIYLWMWSPSEPDAGNWENSSEFAKLTYVEGMTWSFTLTPTAYFNVSADAIAASAGFWFRLKTKTGSKQSGVAQVAYTNFSSFYTANQLIRSYPEQPLINKPLSILFNSNLIPAFADATTVHFHSGLNNWDKKQEYQAWLPDIVEKTKLKNLGNGFYKMDLVPEEYYPDVPDGYVMENIVFLFVKNDWAATSPDQMIMAGEFVPPPPSEFRFFPLQVSKKDFLGVIRKNNEPGITKLIYTVTAGTTVLTGEFTGGTAEIKGFINLVSGLQNVQNVTEIHVLVKDNTDRIISDTTIPLKTLD